MKLKSLTVSLAVVIVGMAAGGNAEAQYRANSSSGTMHFNNPQSALVQTMIDNPYKTRGGSGASQGSSTSQGSSASSGRASSTARGAPRASRSSGSKVARDAAKAAAAAAAIGIAVEVLSSGNR